MSDGDVTIEETLVVTVESLVDLSPPSMVISVDVEDLIEVVHIGGLGDLAPEVIDVIDLWKPVEVVQVADVVIEGPQGPPGDDAEWVSMTQAEFDALAVRDPNTLYVIIG